MHRAWTTEGRREDRRGTWRDRSAVDGDLRLDQGRTGDNLHGSRRPEKARWRRHEIASSWCDKGAGLKDFQMRHKAPAERRTRWRQTLAKGPPLLPAAPLSVCRNSAFKSATKKVRQRAFDFRSHGNGATIPQCLSFSSAASSMAIPST